MKKILSIFALAAAMSLSASAQGLGDLLGGLTSNSTVNDILGSLGNVIYSAPISLNGTYTYTGSAVSMTKSDGNLLSNLAGTESVSGGFKMLFPANKLLGFLKKCASVAGQRSSEIAAIASLADGYDTFKVGFTLIKQ